MTQATGRSDLLMQLQRYDEFRRNGYEHISESDVANELSTGKASLLDKPDIVRKTLLVTI